MDCTAIRRMKQRRYRMIPVAKIEVINSRGRERKQFAENVRSIGEIGLYKPILVNEREFKERGVYLLVCGEGRLLAHRELGKKEIKAEVVDLDPEEHQLMTLGENLARAQPRSIEFGRALQEMKKRGIGLEEMSRITGRSPSYLSGYLRLVADGEERLIQGVEEGVFPLSFAMKAAASEDRSVQHLLMDAFDDGVVNSTNLGRVRRIIEERLSKGKELSTRGKPDARKQEYTVTTLKRDIRKITRDKEAFVYEMGQKENRLFRMLEALRRLAEDETFVGMLKAEGLELEPNLKGAYTL